MTWTARSSAVVDLRKSYRLGDVTDPRAARRGPSTSSAARSCTVVGASGSGKSTLHEHPGPAGPTRRPAQYLLEGEDVSGFDQDRAGGPAEPEDRVRVPELQPAAAHDRDRERRAAAALQRRAQPAGRAPCERAGACCRRWAWATASHHAQPALGRPAAARGHRARARQRPADPARPTSRPATSTAARSIEIMDAAPEPEPGARHHHHRSSRTSPTSRSTPSA